jgi:hypothetical protein
MTSNDPTTLHDSLDAVIASDMLAVNAGDDPNCHEMIARRDDLFQRAGYEARDRVSVVSWSFATGTPGSSGSTSSFNWRRGMC